MTVAKRLAHVTNELGPCFVRYIIDFKLKTDPTGMNDNNKNSNNNDDDGSNGSNDMIALQKQHATHLRQALTNLGPAFVKAGQQLSIRPDLVPAAALKELQRLCDAVQPVPDEVALRTIREELQCDDLSTIFADLHLVASASLGQVYKATLVETGEQVAIKVQRPGMLQSFSLDLFLLQLLGEVMDGFVTTFTKQAPYHRDLFNTFAMGSYSELDYDNEAANQLLFRRELSQRGCRVKIPNVYLQHTTQRVLTTEWIDGVRLADASRERIRQLIPDGVELFLIQLLDIGMFHSDPHPGNLYVTDDGHGDSVLCLLDFGLCAEVDKKARRAMTKAIVHLLTGDFDALVAEDAKELGFLPDDLDTDELKPILKTILTKGLLESGSDLHRRKRKLMEISNELNDVFFNYPFSVPPFFALVTRGLGLLEGIAISGDPDFDIFRASMPYATRRAMEMMGTHVQKQGMGRWWWSSSSLRKPSLAILEEQNHNPNQ